MLRFITHKFKSHSLNEVRPLETQGCQGWVFEDPEKVEPHNNSGEVNEVAQCQWPDHDEARCGISNNNEKDAIPLSPKKQEFIVPNEERPAENGPFLLTLERTCLQRDVDLSSEDKLEDDAKENHPFCIPTRELTFVTKFNCSEKRKFSEVKRRKAESGSDSSSSDDEIKELCSHGVSKIRAGSSPPDKIIALTPLSGSCQRKRNRMMQRPSINFDRMQQTLMLKRHRNRVVRVRLVQPASAFESSYNPEFHRFKPIAIMNPYVNRLVPVEEPVSF